jgi:hypothetical protein
MTLFLWRRHKRVIPVPQLQSLDARDIIKHRSYIAAREAASEYPCERWKEVYESYRKFNDRSRALLPEVPRVPLPEVPDMIVFSDSDDSDSDDFCSFDDEFVAFEVVKKC